MRIYHRTGPDSGISYGLGEWLFFWSLVIVGAAPFVAVAILFIVVVVAVAMVIGALLTLNGIIYHMITGKDARVWVPGSDHGTAIEYWMEEKGWIRLPSRLTPTRNT